MMSFINELKWRGMLFDVSEGLESQLNQEATTAYIGFDPSAASLHVGSLLPIMGLVHLQRHGHHPIAVVGGGTGMIGDPSGKSQERKLLSSEAVEQNLLGIRQQLSRFLDFGVKKNSARIVNNADWLLSLNLVEFLRDIGKHFTVNYMLSKESVKRRLEHESGLSFTEFSYMLLQAYDYLMLYERHGCTLQMGGSDQWGNIVAGCELIRRLQSGRAHALVFPLVTTATGVKFGKTEAGTIWLDPELTSPFRFYQFWLNTDDKDVIHHLKFFTLLSKDEITELEVSLEKTPEKREAQVRLAREVTLAVHDATALDRAERASQVLFGGEIHDVNANALLEIFADVPATELAKDSIGGEGMALIEILIASGYVSSKAEAKRLIDGGGIYINNKRVSDTSLKINVSLAIDGRVIVLRKGKKDYHLVKVMV